MPDGKGAAGPALPRSEPLSPGRGRYGRQNLAVLLVQTAGWALLLTAIDRAESPWIRAGLVVILCMLLQGVFSLMHEYFHKNAHESPGKNYLIGLWGSLLFGTSPTLHRINHWGHHVRNRSEAERGEFIHPGEHPLGKVVLYYFAILGGLWLSGVVFPILALLVPYVAIEWLSQKKRFNTYSAAFEQFKARDWTHMRLEALALLAFWSALALRGPWRVETLAITYGAFAVSWSSLQWVYHLRTPIHVIEGAYNLRAWLPVRVLFLSFNYNLTHHRHPGLPWQELAAHTDVKETQPLWYRWLRMLEPPRRLPSDFAYLEKTYF